MAPLSSVVPFTRQLNPAIGISQLDIIDVMDEDNAL
jgi:hypothetical protein